LVVETSQIFYSAGEDSIPSCLERDEHLVKDLICGMSFSKESGGSDEVKCFNKFRVVGLELFRLAKKSLVKARVECFLLSLI
jgi:hypothetical protein